MTFYSHFPEHYEAVFPFRPVTFTFLCNQLIRKGASVLDLGCGTGHYTGAFARLGYRALGVDMDEAMIAHATRNHPDVEFACSDIRKFKPGRGNLDLCFCIGNTAAHLRPGDFQSIVQKIYEWLVPGSVWVLQTVNWDKLKGLEEYVFPDIVLPDEGVRFCRRYRKLDGASVRFATELKSPLKTLFKGDVTLYPLLQEEYIRLFEKAGLSFKQGFGDFSRSPYMPDASAANVMLFTKT